MSDRFAVAAKGCPADLLTAVMKTLGDYWVTPKQFNDLIQVLADIHAYNKGIENA